MFFLWNINVLIKASEKVLIDKKLSDRMRDVKDFVARETC